MLQNLPLTNLHSYSVRDSSGALPGVYALLLVLTLLTPIRILLLKTVLLYKVVLCVFDIWWTVLAVELLAVRELL